MLPDCKEWNRGFVDSWIRGVDWQSAVLNETNISALSSVLNTFNRTVGGCVSGRDTDQPLPLRSASFLLIQKRTVIGGGVILDITTYLFRRFIGDILSNSTRIT